MFKAASCSLFLLFILLLSSYSCADRPSSHRIKNIPYHQQIESYDCGEASLEMVLNSCGPDVDQRAIMDVARASDQEGTLSYDLIRAGHFSVLSKAALSVLFPAQAPQAGWFPTRPYGLASFGYPRPPIDDQTKVINSTCWLSELKDIISNNIPVITLMNFTQGSSTGHYRVAMGYDENSIILQDPWNRDNGTGISPRVVNFTNEVMCELWSHQEPNGNVTYPPFFALMATPWKIDAHYDWSESGSDLMTITANIEYPCFPPFCKNGVSSPEQYGAEYSQAVISLPSRMTVEDGTDTIKLGTLLPGQKAKAIWNVRVIETVNKTGIQEYIAVNAFGQIQGSVPYMQWTPQGQYLPGYSYNDLIGGFITIAY